MGEALLYPAMPTSIYAVAAVQWVRCVAVESGLQLSAVQAVAVEELKRCLQLLAVRPLSAQVRR